LIEGRRSHRTEISLARLQRTSTVLMNQISVLANVSALGPVDEANLWEAVENGENQGFSNPFPNRATELLERMQRNKVLGMFQRWGFVRPKNRVLRGLILPGEIRERKNMGFL